MALAGFLAVAVGAALPWTDGRARLEDQGGFALVLALLGIALLVVGRTKAAVVAAAGGAAAAAVVALLELAKAADMEQASLGSPFGPGVEAGLCVTALGALVAALCAAAEARDAPGRA
ncbi:MAG TPA: hypothetical protein VNN10_04600 [Dehalococcoidia bacterium]|nr:hypothetical protein [Dehalococcoidia bacterium]